MANAEGIDWAAIRYQHAQAVRAKLAETYSPATVNKALSALRGVLRESWRLGLVTAEDYHRASDLEAVRGETLPRGRALGAGELAALMSACCMDAGPSGARDAALLALLYGGGLRRSEAVAGRVQSREYSSSSGIR
jgi:site-specific recombinase XerD